MMAGAVAVFFWAVRNGQFDDLDTPALDILGDDTAPRPDPTPPKGSDRQPHAD